MVSIAARRSSVASVVLLPLVLCGLGVWVVANERILGIVWLAASVALLLAALWQVVVPPRVTLTPTAIRVRTGTGARSYAWVDCTDFHLWTRGRGSCVAFAYSGHEGGALSDADGRRAQADRALPVLAGVDGAAVLETIETYLAAPAR